MGKYPYVCVWRADTAECEQVAEVGAVELPKAETERMWEMTDHIQFYDGRRRTDSAQRRYKHQ